RDARGSTEAPDARRPPLTDRPRGDPGPRIMRPKMPCVALGTRDREPLPPLRPAPAQNLAPVLALHPGAKAMLLPATPVVGLVRPLHRSSKGKSERGAKRSRDRSGPYGAAGRGVKGWQNGGSRPL